MVLYYADGQVVKAQEVYLEDQAKAKASQYRYADPIEQATQIIQGRRLAADNYDSKEKTGRERVHIVIDKQMYTELYYSESSTLVGQHLPLGREDPSDPIPVAGIDRQTLIKCSSTAYDYFTSNPELSTLHLPVCYPRRHFGGWYNCYRTESGRPDYEEFERRIGSERIEQPGLAYLRDADDQMAYIRETEVIHYLIPWLEEMEKHVKHSKNVSEENKPEEALRSLPKFDIPKILIEKIHLYNVMLQLGISSHFKQPLIDALIFQMYGSNLSQCHLDTLEMTVGRFYSRGIAVLDPVINHLIGTYSLRNPTDRSTDPSEEDRVLRISPEGVDERDEESQVYLKAKPGRAWLEYRSVPPDTRSAFPDDTVIQPPKLEVIGHCIRHWSGVRRSGSTAAAHTGYPLNVGRVFKYYRRRATSSIHVQNRPGRIDRADYSTYRLHNSHHLRPDELEHFCRHRPGSTAAAAPAPIVSQGPSPSPGGSGIASK
ncbi:hypothetical protein DE146DRAFT_766328 [Phaeosphaeria sp. MPI-PUGE-AT-0046c]|nr:hypothetical protein DE146DRAFT_766328 [Phaeosphaeria sp. MPI-PUGE-AT-0046c]